MLGFFELFVKGGVSNVFAKVIFQKPFLFKACVFDPCSLFRILYWPNRSLWLFFFFSVSNSTANEGAIGPKGIPAAYMKTECCQNSFSTFSLD